MRAAVRSALAAASLIAVSGCSWLPKPETGGQLHVGRPQVFARERLLNERLGEVNWLREQVKREVDPAFQGIRDIRSAQAFVAQLGIQLDVIQARLDTGRRSNDEAAQSRLAERERLQHEIDMAKLRQQLDDVNNRVKQDPPAAEPDQTLKTEILKLSGEIKELKNKVETLAKAPASPAAGLPSTGAAQGLLDPSKSRTLDPSAAVTSRAAPTTLERFDDQAAYRDLVNARIREKILDDSHDLSGLTLYEMKFDVTFAPGSSTRRYAMARITLADPLEERSTDKIVTESFVERTRRVLDEEINDFSKRLHDRARMGALSETWKRRVLTSFDPDAVSAILERCSIDARVRQRLFSYLAARETEAPRKFDPNDSNGFSCLLANFIMARFASSLDPFFDFRIVALELPEGERFYKINVSYKRVRSPTSPSNRSPVCEKAGDEDRTTASMSRREMCNAFHAMRTDHPPRVATIEPKEYAQNISDAGSRSEASQLGLVLDLVTTKGANVKSFMERFSQEQQMLHAVRRQPLAMSFLQGEDAFGWVLGPKFSIDDKQRADFVHTPARHVFTASIVVPGWMTSVGMSAEACWIGRDGTQQCSPLALDREKPDKGKGETVGKVKPLQVELPSAYHRAFIPALLRHNQGILREPELFLLPEQYQRGKKVLRAAPEQCVGTIQPRCEQTIVIEGRELWRNPEVFIGSQKAEVVELLPNMRGLAATFRALRAPVSANGQARGEDLLVVTSIGSDRLPGAVVVLPALVSAPKPFMRTRTAYVDKGAPKAALEFAFEPAALPAGFHSMLARARIAGSKEWKELGVASRLTPGLARFEFDPAAVGLGDKAAQIEVDVGLRFNPEDDFHSMLDPASRLVTYYPNVHDRSVVATQTAPLDFSKSPALGAKEQDLILKRLTYTLPKDEALFRAAYPGLEAALDGRGGNARFVVSGPSGVSVPLDAARASLARATRVYPAAASIARLAPGFVPRNEEVGTFNIKLEYRIGGADWQEIPIKDGNSVQITGLQKAPKPAANAPQK